MAPPPCSTSAGSTIQALLWPRPSLRGGTDRSIPTTAGRCGRPGHASSPRERQARRKHASDLRHAAAPRLPQSYIDAIDGVAIGPTGGSCITAAYRAAPVVVADIAVDPLWAAYRHLPLAHGLRASWSAPILSSAGQVLGTFAMYYREPRSPRPHDLEVLEQMAAVAAVAIQHQRAHERVRHEEQELRRIVDAIPQTIVVLGPA